MKKKLIFNVLFIVFSLVTVLTSCSDWMDTESLTIKETDIEKDNPELYAQYLANLREYRNREHKITYVWFDNTADIPRSRGEQIKALPDSVDIVNLMNPDELSSWVLDDMNSVRKEKGMKFVFTISYLDLEKEYELYLLQNPTEETGEATGEEEVDGFLAYAADYVDRNLALVDKYGYDGISVLFHGTKTTHMRDDAKEAYLAREAAFISKITEWVNSHSDKLFIFEGYPQNLTDKSLLQKAKYIVLRTESLTFALALSLEVKFAIEEGVPTDRFVVTVPAKSLDPEDMKTGYYFNANNEPVSAMLAASEWVDSPEPKFFKAGLGILNVRNDYYIPGNSYWNIRNAINTMNPSPKL